MQTDTSLPATYVGLHLKSLVKRELGIDHLQDLLQLQGQKAAAEDNEVSDELQRLADNLEKKLNVLDMHLSNMTRSLMQLQEGYNATSTALLPPCCSSNQDQADIQEGCSVIHLGFNGTRIARLATSIFHRHDPPMGSFRRFFMTTDRTTHLEYPGARACGQRLTHGTVKCSSRLSTPTPKGP